MKEVLLRMREEEKYKIIKELVDHNGNKKRASINLSLSIRQINRLIISYKERGKAAFVHGNRSKTPVNKTDEHLSNEIIRLYKEKYTIKKENNDDDDEIIVFNFNHFRDMLEDEEKIKVSYTYLYNLLMKDEIMSPYIHRATRKRIIKEKILQEKANQNKSDEEIEKEVNNIVSYEFAHPRKDRSKNFGEVIEMDASSLDWFSGQITHLHLAVDNSTGMVVGAWFDTQETLLGYYNVFKQILLKFGIPYSFLTDKRTVFTYNDSKRKDESKDVLTQFGYACKILGVQLKCTSIPQAKGIIERLNGSFQRRLKNEMHLKGISSIDEANKYLIEVFVPKYNKEFALPVVESKSVFEPMIDKTKINDILSIIATRKIDTGHAISYKNKYYVPSFNKEKVCFRKGTKCLIINTFDNRLICSIDNKIYDLTEVAKPKAFSTVFDNIEVDESNSRKSSGTAPKAESAWTLNNAMIYKEEMHRQFHIKE